MGRNALSDAVPRLSIGEMARRTGCRVETIRYYERCGILPPPARTEGGHRIYGTAHLKRLGFIRRARDLGFTLDEVRALLRLADQKDSRCAEARDLAARHLAALRARLAELRRLETVLAGMIAGCETEAAPACPLIEALFDAGGRAATMPG
jgi:MerR family mercuric resistance operon transcriptional regulator